MNQHYHQAWASQQNAKITFCCLTKKSAENTGFSLLLIKETLLIKLPSSAELRRHASIAISTPTQGFATLIEEEKKVNNTLNYSVASAMTRRRATLLSICPYLFSSQLLAPKLSALLECSLSSSL